MQPAATVVPFWQLSTEEQQEVTKQREQQATRFLMSNGNGGQSAEDETGVEGT